MRKKPTKREILRSHIRKAIEAGLEDAKAGRVVSYKGLRWRK